MRIKSNGIDLFYTKSGGGAPLLLLHGNGEDHHIFDAISARLEQDFTVYALDSRNHGQSAKAEDCSYNAMAEDVHGLIRSLELGRVDIVGFSDGAIIALLLAMRHGEVLRKMALLGVNLTPEDFTEENLQFVRQTYEDTGDPLFKLMLEQPNIALEDVRGVGTPTLVVAAEHDIFRPELFQELTAALPNGELKIMTGHDHSSYIDNRDLLYPDLLQFFCCGAISERKEIVWMKRK